MKRFFLFFAMLGAISLCTVDAQVCSNLQDVATISRQQKGAYRQGEVIVKFKADSRANVKSQNGAPVRTSVNAIDALFDSLGVVEAEQLMPLSGAGGPTRSRGIDGGYVESGDMSKLYCIRFDQERTESVYDAIDAIEKIDVVEFAEPNYIVYATSNETTDCDHYEKEPLFKEQWAFNAINLKNVWTKKKITDKRPVIAILDTGVDITHPDLAENIWTNEREADGIEEADDDANGYADDIHGWDFVNKTPRIGDWNGHGTHVAGIAAAVGKNGKGITGANPDALIMPVTIMQSDGTGDIATIIKGIDYAAANGADVINMSFGSYNYSIPLEQALARAYNKAVLVAAAGNDCLPINPFTECSACKKIGSPMFPAAFTFVLGVESSDHNGNRASFSNYDDDGATFSAFGDEKLYNYELRAPGTAIMSTFPGGKYKALSGTSMASPLVAGAISRLLQCKDYSNKELLFGDLIHARKKSSQGIVDFLAAYEVSDEDRIPELQFVTYALEDSIGGDGDNRPDAGETLCFYPTLRNEWGLANNITFSLAVDEAEDPTTVEFLDNNVSFGKSLGSYAKGRSNNPLRIKINENCADGRKIRLVLRAKCDNIATELEHHFTIAVENGVEIGGIIGENTTLYPNVHYIVTKKILIPSGVALTIKPGTVLKFKDGTGIENNGIVDCVGKPDSMIVFRPADLLSGVITTFDNFTLKYTRVEELNGNRANLFVNCNFENCAMLYCNNQRLISTYNLSGPKSNVNKSNFFYNNIRTDIIFVSETTLEYLNIISNNHNPDILSRLTVYEDRDNITINQKNNIFNNTNKNGDIANISFVSGNIQYIANPQVYFGTADAKKAQLGVFDINHPYYSQGNVAVNLNAIPQKPWAEAHGIVWKVVVNDYDAQDQFELLPPLGVGKHKFEVYFNRPMDVSVAPTIAMGVRQPYTQTAIAEDGAWSADSLVYTAYLTLDAKNATDGLNRIYVADARDNEYFDIPIENLRFNVQVAVAGSMATGLMVEPGLGKANLTWETDEEDFEDLLGYNIYRYSTNEDGICSDTTIVNSQVLESTEQSFSDYDVVPGTTYYYYIKQITTALNSYSISNVVACTPLTAQKGDANGSMAVDVADVVTEVAWLTNQNPQPFIFEAADVNSDNEVNILDVVGTVNIITKPEQAATAAVNSTATYTIENGVLYVESPVALGGVQLRIAAERGTEFTALEGIANFEQMGDWQNDNEYLFLAFSMTGESIASGKQAILKVGDARISDVVLSDVRGSNVLVIDGNATGVGQIEAMQMQLPYPNPFSTELNIPYIIGKDGAHDVKIAVSDIMGRVLHSYSAVNEFGKYAYCWRPGAEVANGLYLVSLYVDGCLMQTAKVVYRK